MKIGYGKLGRSMPLTLEKCGSLGGDVEMVAVVKQLAERHPDDDFFLLGRNSGERPQDVGLPGNVHNPWTEWSPLLRRRLNDAGLNHGNLSVADHLRVRDLIDHLTQESFILMDAHVWWVGQHGTTNNPIPRVDDPSELTKPYDWCAYYAGFILRGINAWRGVHDWTKFEEIWINADPRNKHKMRDLKYPLRHPVLTQFNYSHPLKYEQYDGHEPIVRRVDNVYSRLEINGLAPGTPFGDLLSYSGNPHGRGHFGLFINEARRGVTNSRKDAVRDWVLPLDPTFIHGTWSDQSQEELGVTIKPAPWAAYVPTLQSVRSTLTTPSSGSGWATTKPWEAFACGTVCFFHPRYDVQDNILADAPHGLRNFLRVATPRELKDRVTMLETDNDLWHSITAMQREHYQLAMAYPRWLHMIEDRIWK